jgi:tRNA modification GTPase
MANAPTIAAIATAPGKGGVGVIRVSGEGVQSLARTLLGKVPPERQAVLATFRDAQGRSIDQGLALYFQGPRSFIGEDVLELHAHGGQALLRLLLARCIELGARVAEPGEFTRRAFLNDKLDLAQAESVADLIEASSDEAVRSAARSLAGEFSGAIHVLVRGLIDVRMHVEACVDFPEEEIDPADRAAISQKISRLFSNLEALVAQSTQGAILREGLQVVLVGRPNVGKSSLLNRLAREEVAIVTPIAGTTRDQVKVSLNIGGVPVHLIDTAGLRETDDPVERIGIDRTWKAIETAGAALILTSAEDDRLGATELEIVSRLPGGMPRAWIINKIDLFLGQNPVLGGAAEDGVRIRVSAKTGEGIESIERWLLDVAGWHPGSEGVFMARARHLEALHQARAHLGEAGRQPAFELLAEELRLAQGALSRITGEFAADDLLGEIFSRFCIGK